MIKPHVWPELKPDDYQDNFWPSYGETPKTVDGTVSVSKSGYDRARLCVAYCFGVSNETLEALFECNRKLAEKLPPLLGEIAE